MTDKTSKKTFAAFWALILSIFGWGSAPVFIRWLGDAYDPYSQAFIRYASAAVVLTVICSVGYRQEFLKILRNPRGVWGIALITMFLQTFWTLGCLKTSSATVAQLISKLSIVLVIPMGYVMFREERTVIKNPSYLFGTLLSLVGLAAVVSRDGDLLTFQFDMGTGYLILAAILWAVYTVWARHIALGVHPLPMFTVMAIFVTVGLGVVSLLMGSPKTLISAGAPTAGLAFVSGMFPIALAHPCFHYAQRHLGSAFCSSMNLINPLATFLFSLVILPNEKLLLHQWVGAALLLGGTFLVARASHGLTEENPISLENRGKT
ncbi:MAG TPA: DMT family transporter [Candidatus Hydrogenedentes bacterium]|nr:DMT family transporter [Candidatus Hydrogenedentota bacterium]HOL77462.1 DMT family transporter [Candidatus Hydrogenedentota bacterium]HPO86291.1 DMT family transporter [Candidatus Hydrogenedentota bacterium]